ncbi:MAG: HDOD domain-containing protein [Candidatus Hydrogenedentes bacterium]|nr:HDOD domain-containing protein [Candidatus Hydrogenedentota bacterium]
MSQDRTTTTRSPAAPRRIGELLVREGLITPGQLQEALEKQRSEGGKIVENLIALGHMDTGAFVRFLSHQPGTVSIDLLNYTIPQDVIQLVDRDFALKHEVLPIDKMGKNLSVGMACPLDAATVAELEQKTGLRVRPFLVAVSDVRTALKRYYNVEVGSPDSYTIDGDKNVALSARVVAAPAAPISLVESGLKFEKVVHLIRKVSSLPALPETVSKVREAIEHPDTSTDQVAAIIGQDPSLAAKVVSLANSAAYAFTHKVQTIERATALLGLREVYSVVLASAVIEYFDKGSGFDYKRFWTRSMTCATACREIARIKRKNGASALFAAGLVHDIGRAALATIAPKPYTQVDQELPDDLLIVEENEHFGIAHPEVGYMLADGWGLPREIKEPIRFHHDFKSAQAAHAQVAVVALGACIADLPAGLDPAAAARAGETHAELLEILEMDGGAFAVLYQRTMDLMSEQQQIGG